MAAQHTWKLDKKVTAMMVEDMLFDPILAAKVLLRVKLPPHEELRVMWMWTTYYTNDDSGFSTGKSWTIALVSALRSILMTNRISGVLSKTFAQGKLIFRNYDKWYNSAPLFRSCIKHYNSKPRLVHATDVWSAHFRGGAEIRVLPPNFMQDAERIRSERWNDGYFDEWTTYGNFRVFNSTIIGRVTEKNHYPDCPVRQNHIHLKSTPQFKHHPSYRMVRQIDYQMAIGNKDYGRFTCNYRHVPKRQQWNFVVNRKTIFHMQTNLPRGIVKSEIDGKWSEDSQSYYPSNTVEQVRHKNLSLVKQRSNDKEIFIAGMDVARGGGDSVSANEGDDFSLSVMRMIVGEWFPHHVLTVRASKASEDFMSGIAHKYHRKMNFGLMVFDPGGGGLFVRDKMRLEEQLIDNEKVKCTPMITFMDTSGTIGNEILVPLQRGSHLIDRMWGKMASDSVLINRAHQLFKGAIENKNTALAPEWTGWDHTGSNWDVVARREWLNKTSGLTEDDKLNAERDLAVGQLMTVDVERDKDGNPLLDSFNMYSFGHKRKKKKDAAYSLLFSYIGCLIYRWMTEEGTYEKDEDDKDSVVFVASDL